MTYCNEGARSAKANVDDPGGDRPADSEPRGAVISGDFNAEPGSNEYNIKKVTDKPIKYLIYSKEPTTPLPAGR